MVRNLKTVLSTYRKMTKRYQGYALATLACYSSATATQRVLVPMFVASVLANMASNAIEVFTPFWLFAGGIILANVLFRIGDWCIVQFESKSIVTLRQNAIESIIAQPQSFFMNSFSGALVARMARFERSFETMFDILAFGFLFSAIQVIGIFIVLSFKSLIMASIVLAWAALYVFISIYTARLRVAIDSHEAELSSKLTGVSADIIGNAFTIMLFGRRKAEMKYFKQENKQQGAALKRSWMYSNIQNGIQGFLTAALEVGALGAALLLWRKGQLNAADVALVYFYMGIISNTMWEVGKHFVRFSKATTDATEMIDIFKSTPEVNILADDEDYDIADGSVVINDLTFSYTVGKNVFSNLHLTIPHGQHVGVVGTTGAGKSTLIAMLMRFRDPLGGVIEIGGVDIASIEHDALRRQIAIVPQDVSLLHRTIFENIGYGAKDPTMEQVIDAAKKAQIHDTIMQFSQGYNTVVGERGIKLSGGQRQRIAIARALVIDAKIIVLDEATSSLDSITETYIQEILQNELQGKTVIIIAHRLATVRDCDRIIVLENGAIKEDGSHYTLMEQNGFYTELVKHQYAQ